MYEFTVDQFEGRCVVVTGAARGIGRATALAFAEHGAAPETTRMDIFPIDNSFGVLVLEVLASSGCLVTRSSTYPSAASLAY